MEAAVGAPDGGDQGGAAPREDATPMDAYLRKLGLYRKLVAKDGSCLFRAVAEQVLHSQSRHVEVRMACIHYLRENREKFEAVICNFKHVMFIEGSFEEYLKRLENPQEWVGQVEISALSLMYRKDFIIYREPNVSPSQVTENNFPEKVLLCFSNGNHYDIVYPIKYKESSAVCQSLLYELLYEKVFKTDVSKILMGLDTSEVADENNSEISDSEDDSCKSKTTTVNDVNGFKSLSNDQHPKSSGNSPSLPLSRKVLKSLSPAVYRNVEYEIWLKSKQAQQKHDYSIAAGLQYEVGDKCQVRLDHNGKFSNADFQGVHSENGPVLVEELGKKLSPKNLRPPSSESWNTVAGKKMKKPPSGQNFHCDADYRGPRAPAKPGKAPPTLPPRLQHPPGLRQRVPPGHSAAPQSQKPSSEHRSLSRTPTQATRKPDRERAEDFDATTRESNYFGLSPEERREKQAIEESRLLYEIQNRDEQAFPALSSSSVSQSASQSSNPGVQRKSSHGSDRKGSRRRMDTEERKDKDSVHGHIPLDKKPEPGTLEKPAEHVCLSSPAPLLVSPEVHLTPAVPSLPATVPAWPSEPTTFGPTGVPAQIPVLSVTQTLTTGPDSAVSQAHLTPSPVPVSIQAVNQPLMPLPQTLSLYQDPLYPGFPCNEKGDRAIAPPYSLCHTGEDLPKDKNILRFFFNLGVKAYSCPMWAPHSYLYPLHQAYLAACRMYPKVPVPVYPQNPWFQEAPSAQNESDCACPDAHFPVQPEASVNGQMPQAEIGPPTFSSTLVIPPPQVSESHGQLSYQADLESENSGQLLHAEYEESLSGKNMFPQPSFGPNPFLGPVPIAPPFFPHVWYGYPFQGFIENPVMRQNIVLPSDEKGELDLPLENLDLSKECASVSAADEFPEAGGEDTHPLPEASVSEHGGQVEQSSQTPKSELALAPVPPVAEGKARLPTPVLNREREAVPVEPEPKRTIPSLKEKPEKVKDPKTAADAVSGASSVDNRVPRPKEESSEDESEVSDILRSGRSKQFYNQTYGGRKYKSDWGYSGRGGYPHVRGEESWKGQPSRSRDEGYQYHRNARGRPYRGDRRRSGLGDGHRGQHT
ncbi:OTU domain-containing protein 4 isoform X3 [Sagmatias obliquidens]|uniref:OTU domain-containing protein 4 isoform X3 n=1 Tax=Sagmatias obliquidens TaxID=3371155 RepID=UPI000F445D40|nr:OTU domain-containing protein 4 isoform X3 [Lagenorhynchus obliquidens]